MNMMISSKESIPVKKLLLNAYKTVIGTAHINIDAITNFSETPPIVTVEPKKKEKLERSSHYSWVFFVNNNVYL